MNTQDSTYLYGVLCRAIREEQREYIADLLSQPPAYILSHAHEYVIREKIKSSINIDTLDDDQIRALLAIDKPLDLIYRIVGAQELIAVNDIINGVIETSEYCINKHRIAEAIMIIEMEALEMS